MSLSLPPAVVEHVRDLVALLLEHKVEDFYDTFEEISFMVKESKLENSVVDIQREPIEVLTKAKERAELLEGNRDETNKVNDDFEIADVIFENVLLQSFGEGLTESEALLLTHSLRRLAQTNPISSIRFWGIIKGTMSDYYIAETVMKTERKEDALPGSQLSDRSDDVTSSSVPTMSVLSSEMSGMEFTVDTEKEATEGKESKDIPMETDGPNKYTYWVASSIDSDWVSLGPVFPSHIVAARLINKKFTGNLNTEMNCYPTFPGNESVYLRAQIARINASASVSPTGYYAMEGEDDESTNCIISEEFHGAPLQSLTEISSWNHHQPYLLPQGRTQYYSLPKVRDEVESEGEEEEEDAEDPLFETGPKLLTSIEEDSLLDDGSLSWKTQTIPIPFTSMLTSAIICSNNRWRGSISMAYTGIPKKIEEELAIRVEPGNVNTVSFFYFGDGMKTTGSAFFPPIPPIPQTEFVLLVRSEEEDEEVESDFIEQLDPTLEVEKELEERLKAEAARKKAEERDEEDEDEDEDVDDEEEEEDD